MGTGEHKQCCQNQKNGSVPADALIRLHCMACQTKLDVRATTR